MLTETQTELIAFLSLAVWGGIVWGGLAGVLVGALIRVMRTHRFWSFFVGALCAALPAAAIAVAVSLVFALFQIVVCKPGYKWGWDVPVWLLSIEMVAVLAAGVVGAVLAQRPHRAASRRRILIAVLLGAVVGALALVGPGFEGYYVLQSNAGPIGYAATGFVIGGVTVLLWRVVIEKLDSGKVRG